jgi:hypothetical protein
MRELEFVFYSGGLKGNRDMKEMLDAGEVKGRLQELREELSLCILRSARYGTHLPDLYDFCRVEIE